MDVPYFLRTENIIKEQKPKSKTVPKLGALAVLAAVVLVALFKGEK